jgi:hypothetical protein
MVIDLIQLDERLEFIWNWISYQWIHALNQHIQIQVIDRLQIAIFLFYIFVMFSWNYWFLPWSTEEKTSYCNLDPCPGMIHKGDLSKLTDMSLTHTSWPRPLNDLYCGFLFFVVIEDQPYQDPLSIWNFPESVPHRERTYSLKTSQRQHWRLYATLSFGSSDRKRTRNVFFSRSYKKR